MESLLELKDVSIDFQSKRKSFNIIKNINLKIDRKMKYGIVGESGSGKSLTSLAVMNLLSDNLSIGQGEIILRTEEEKVLNHLSKKAMRDVRGEDIAMIFQEPMTALDPLYTIEYQIIEVLKYHRKMSKKEMREKAIAMLTSVGISRPEKIMDDYPHQLSGGCGSG